ncbi:polyprenyl synthetase family protein [Streptomyces griseoviridis]|uniref:polyprenyl synthetase family protein n=1 Tax=Streptomyces TaxID=1883 RepID=UPI002476B642|nr:polyprenyl synthetase family protein [Streptomyces sp. MAA16]MDH6696474.1 geranylgeranyl diphosphate synthase type I [Streptomyces sp. MAA16]
MNPSPSTRSTTGAATRDDIVWNLAEHAVSYPAFTEHPGIRAEFVRSLHKRTRLWEPLLSLLAAEFDHRPSEASARVLSGWFTMVHLSAPIDQLVDRDPMSDHWRRLGGAGAIELVLALKDQVFRAPLLALDPGTDPGTAHAVTRATVELGSACLTASIGEYLDVVGYSELRSEPPFPAQAAARVALFYEQLVGWKSSVIYECLLRCAALTMEAPAPAVDALAAFGHHIGFAVQVLDDAGGVWGGGDDLEKEPVKVTSPLAYALTVDHPQRDELVDLLHTPAARRDVKRTREILDDIQARAFLEFLIRDRISLAVGALTDVLPGLVAPLERWADAYFRRTAQAPR